MSSRSRHRCTASSQSSSSVATSTLPCEHSASITIVCPSFANFTCTCCAVISTGAYRYPGFGVAYSRRMVFAVGQVTATVPPAVGITVGLAALVVGGAVVGGVVTVDTGAASGGTLVAGDEVSAVVDVAPGRDGPSGAGEIVGVTGAVVAVDIAAPSGRHSVVDDTANGATARSTALGDTMTASDVVSRVSTRFTAAHASPLVTTVPRIHAPARASRVRTETIVGGGGGRSVAGVSQIIHKSVPSMGTDRRSMRG